MDLTPNERKIITVLARYGELTKKELGARCGIGWATVVKMVDRLISKGIVEKGGTSKDAPELGKNAYVFHLSAAGPRAIGIDVEYHRTNVIVSDLAGSILYQAHYPTPENPKAASLADFLTACCRIALKEQSGTDDHVIGVGIGLPLWILQDHVIGFADVADRISGILEMDVQVQNNVRNFGLYHRWFGGAFGLSDFAIVTIRNGIGGVLYANSHLVEGSYGLAGEIGHLPVVENGDVCHCGKRGCLETMVNQQALYKAYVQVGLGQALDPESLGDQEKITDTLKDLFLQLSAGNRTVIDAIDPIISLLTRGLANLLLLTDVSRVFIAGFFGDSGSALVPLVEEKLQAELLPGTEVDLEYLPLTRDGFALGASMLVFRDIYINLE